MTIQEFRDTFIIWVQFNSRTSGTERRDNLKKLYGDKIANAMNVDKVRTIKSDFGLQLFQPEAPLVSDIAYSEYNKCQR